MKKIANAIFIFLTLIPATETALAENRCPITYKKYTAECSDRNCSSYKIIRNEKDGELQNTFLLSYRSGSEITKGVFAPKLSLQQPIEAGDLERLNEQDWVLIKETNAKIVKSTSTASNEFINRADQLANDSFSEAIDCHLKQAQAAAKGNTRPTALASSAQEGKSTSRNTANPSRSNPPTEKKTASGDEGAEELAAKHTAAFAKSSNFMTVDGASRTTGESRKAIIAKQFPKCLEMVDIRRDKSVPDMIWYAIRNKCGESLRAYWCEGERCSRMTKSWEIPPGKKETTWLTQKGDKQIRLHATACRPSAGSEDVYYDFEKNQCWHWGNW